MKKYFVFKEKDLWRSYRFNQVIKLTGDDDLEEPVDLKWQEKARRMQIRRWRKLKHQLA